MLGWENDKLSLRLSANYKSDYLSEVAGIGDKQHDLFGSCARKADDFTGLPVSPRPAAAGRGTRIECGAEHRPM